MELIVKNSLNLSIKIFTKEKTMRLFLTNLGRLEQQKNQTFLIEIAELNRRNINFHMLIGGKGRLQKNLEKKIKKLKLNDKIDLLGFIKSKKFI